MARHSHFHNIQVKKGAADKIRGKIFTKHAKLIAQAAQKGGDPESNAELRAAIENARADNVPKDNIDRAIKKGSGESKNAVVFQDVVYEGFLSGGVAIVIEAFTDNKNRTAQFVRTNLEKFGGNLGAPGSTAFSFKRRGVFAIKKSDEAELAAIDAGAEDTEIDGENLIVYTEPQDFHTVLKKIKDSGLAVEGPAIAYIPQNLVMVEDPEKARSIEKIVDLLEESEDVVSVVVNGEMA